jgi:hypothetical protein
MAKSKWPRWFKVFGVAYIFSMVLTAGTFWAVGIAVTTLIAYSAIIALGLAAGIATKWTSSGRWD